MESWEAEQNSMREGVSVPSDRHMLTKYGEDGAESTDEEGIEKSPCKRLRRDPEILESTIKSLCSHLISLESKLRLEGPSDHAMDVKGRRDECASRLRNLQRSINGPENAQMRRYISFALDGTSAPVHFTDLLDDEMIMVLKKIPLASGSPKQLAAMSAVCRRLRNLVNLPSVWRTVDLSAMNTSATDRVVVSLARKTHAREDSVNVPTLSQTQHVSLKGCCFLSARAVQELSTVPGQSLRVLDLSNCSFVDYQCVQAFAQQCTQMSWLELRGCTQVPTHTVLRVAANPATWPSLTYLGLTSTYSVSHARERGIVEDTHRACQDFIEGRPGVKLGPLPAQLRHYVSLLQEWDRQASPRCSRCGLPQEVNEEEDIPLTMVPTCGHVFCYHCALYCRANMVRVNPEGPGPPAYAYPCSLCGEDLPSSRGFHIILT